MVRKLDSITVISVVPGKGCLRTKLPPEFTAALNWDDGVREELRFKYNQSGAERDTHESIGKPYTMKSHPARSVTTDSTYYKEWLFSQTNSILPLPVCYGFFTLPIGGYRVDLLVMERTPFTGLDFILLPMST